MSSSTFYCNERMLLENWDYYHESNMTLKNLLMKTDMSPPECADFYYEHMKNRESVTYDRSYIISKFYNKKSKRGKLREINQVVIYQKDFDYVENAKKFLNLSYAAVRALFGIIFFSRMLGSEKVYLDTLRGLRHFDGCYGKNVSIIYVEGETWIGGYNTVTGLPIVSDTYHLVERMPTDNIGCIYRYPEFSLHKEDKVAYIFDVTLETNRLRLENLTKELFDPRKQYCVLCGSEYYTNGPNASLYCKECAKEKERLRMILRHTKVQPKLVEKK